MMYISLRCVFYDEVSLVVLALFHAESEDARREEQLGQTGLPGNRHLCSTAGGKIHSWGSRGAYNAFICEFQRRPVNTCLSADTSLPRYTYSGLRG